MLHCTDTRPSQKYTIEQLKRDHAKRGFGAYPGYHFYVRRDGTLYYCRPLSIKGCHVAGHNAHSIGVCYEGGRSEGPPQIPAGDMQDLAKLESGATNPPPTGGRGVSAKLESRAANPPPTGGRGVSDNRTSEQLITLHFLLSTLHEMFPDAKICGHHDLNPGKQCPCLDPPAAVEYAYIFGHP